MKRSIYLIRHAQSGFNKFLGAAIDRYQLTEDDEHLLLFARVAKKEELIDPHITELGLKQTLLAREKYKEQFSKVKLVMTTAMTRTLDTARGIFDSQNCKDKEFVVLPFFERIQSISDIPSKVCQNFERYPEFDFSLMKDQVERHGTTWFLHKLTNPYLREKLIEGLKEFDHSPIDQQVIQKTFKLTDQLRHLKNTELENLCEFYFRIQNHKMSMKRLLLQPKYRDLKDGEIAFVGHFCFNSSFMATDFDENFFPKNFHRFENCEAVYRQIEFPEDF